MAVDRGGDAREPARRREDYGLLQAVQGLVDALPLRDGLDPVVWYEDRRASLPFDGRHVVDGVIKHSPTPYWGCASPYPLSRAAHWSSRSGPAPLAHSVFDTEFFT